MEPTDRAPIPPTYRPEFAEEARQLALTMLHDWLASVPEFARGVRYGRELGDADLIDRFHQIAMGCFAELVTRPVGAEKEAVTYIRLRPPHGAARNFWLANRFPGEWCKRAEIEPESGHDSARKLTRSELKRPIAEFVAARGFAANG